MSTTEQIAWGDESVRMGAQKNSLELLGNLTHATTIIVATPLNERKQERARRKCLESLLIISAALEPAWDKVAESIEIIEITL